MAWGLQAALRHTPDVSRLSLSGVPTALRATLGAQVTRTMLL